MFVNPALIILLSISLFFSMNVSNVQAAAAGKKARQDHCVKRNWDRYSARSIARYLFYYLFSIYLILGICIYFLMDIGHIPKIILFFVLVFSVDLIKKKLINKVLNLNLK
ncbi:hypothetical protein SRABI96_02676 [Peribacillus sp. Bi96]|nr:hypothetical protein SRABI96_02676 [Peribacillus sp. Bi96]